MIHSIVFEVPVKIEGNKRRYDIPIIQGCDYTLLEDRGVTMIVKMTACSNPLCVDKPISITNWTNILLQYQQNPKIKISTFQRPTNRKAKYGKLRPNAAHAQDFEIFEEEK